MYAKFKREWTPRGVTDFKEHKYKQTIKDKVMDKKAFKSIGSHHKGAKKSKHSRGLSIIHKGYWLSLIQFINQH